MSNYSQFTEVTVGFATPGVLHIQLSKPKKLNAVGEKTWRQYGQALETAALDPEVTAIVISGQGRCFCAGLDLHDAGLSVESETKDPARKGIRNIKFIKDFQDAIKAAYDIKKPVIGVAHGVSYGLAIDMLSNMDIRFAAKDTRFSVREIVIGMAADIGSLQQLPRIIGNQSWLREVIFSGREFSAAEALHHGFVSRVFDTQEETLKAAIEFASQLTNYSPVALHAIKKSLNYAADHTLQEGLDQIAEFNAFAVETDLMAGITAHLQKKKPVYEKL